MRVRGSFEGTPLPGGVPVPGGGIGGSSGGAADVLHADENNLDGGVQKLIAVSETNKQQYNVYEYMPPSYSQPLNWSFAPTKLNISENAIFGGGVRFPGGICPGVSELSGFGGSEGTKFGEGFFVGADGGESWGVPPFWEPAENGEDGLASESDEGEHYGFDESESNNSPYGAWGDGQADDSGTTATYDEASENVTVNLWFEDNGAVTGFSFTIPVSPGTDDATDNTVEDEGEQVVVNGDKSDNIGPLYVPETTDEGEEPSEEVIVYAEGELVQWAVVAEGPDGISFLDASDDDPLEVEVKDDHDALFGLGYPPMPWDGPKATSLWGVNSIGIISTLAGAGILTLAGFGANLTAADNLAAESAAGTQAAEDAVKAAFVNNTRAESVGMQYLPPEYEMPGTNNMTDPWGKATPYADDAVREAFSVAETAERTGVLSRIIGGAWTGLKVVGKAFDIPFATFAGAAFTAFGVGGLALGTVILAADPPRADYNPNAVVDLNYYSGYRLFKATQARRKATIGNVHGFTCTNGYLDLLDLCTERAYTLLSAAERHSGAIRYGAENDTVEALYYEAAWAGEQYRVAVNNLNAGASWLREKLEAEWAEQIQEQQSVCSPRAPRFDPRIPA